MADAHTATLELLEEAGYEQLKLSDVARRAGINKTTVYRRWPTKASLVTDLLAGFTRVKVATPDTGSLQTDLEQLLAGIADTLGNRAVRAVLHGALSGADDDDIRIAQAAFWEERFRRSGDVVEKAIARGDLPPGTDPRALLEMASGPIYFRALFTIDPVTQAYIADVAGRTVRAFA